MESDRPGLFCRDVMSCAVFYNYMRGKSEGDPQSLDVPFQDTDCRRVTIGFADNSETTGWPEAWDTPLKGTNVKDKLVESGATVIEKPHLKDFFVLPQLLLDYEAAGIGNEWFGWWDWYSAHAPHLLLAPLFLTLLLLLLLLLLQVLAQRRGLLRGQVQVRLVEDRTGPVWYGQNTNFDKGDHKHHILASAYALRRASDHTAHAPTTLLLTRSPPHPDAPRRPVDPTSSPVRCTRCSRQMPDVVVHFAQSELNGAVNKGMVKRAGINTVHFPEFFWDVTDTGGWKSGHDAAYEDFYSATPHHPAMITCESKKYEPAKVRRAASSTAYHLHLAQSLARPSASGYRGLRARRLRLPPKELVAGDKRSRRTSRRSTRRSRTWTHDLDCPYLCVGPRADMRGGRPRSSRSTPKEEHRQAVSCKVVTGGCAQHLRLSGGVAEPRRRYARRQGRPKERMRDCAGQV